MCLDYGTSLGFCLGPDVDVLVAVAAKECMDQQEAAGNLNRCDCCDESGDFCIYTFLYKYVQRKLCIKQKLGRVDSEGN